jgi:hypothetical protein
LAVHSGVEMNHFGRFILFFIFVATLTLHFFF